MCRENHWLRVDLIDEAGESHTLITRAAAWENDHLVIWLFESGMPGHTVPVRFPREKLRETRQRFIPDASLELGLAIGEGATLEARDAPAIKSAPQTTCRQNATSELD